MLIKAKDLRNYILHSLDRDIGKVKDLYFDDHHWGIRYLVADTGGWLVDRQVLISPYALKAVNPGESTISVNLTRQQIEESPVLSSDEPVSQQFEESYYSHYGWSKYWNGPLLWGNYPYLESNTDTQAEIQESPQPKDLNLRSIQEVLGYQIQAKDGNLGHVEDFILDDENWAVRYLLVNTLNWWSGKKVLISPKWIESVSWKKSKVFVKHLKETITQSPEYTDMKALTRDAEKTLHGYYASRGYWLEELKALDHHQGK